MPTPILYRDPEPRSGQRNMAIDAWMLTQAIDAEQLSFRFYQWNQPTLSLGYFQEKTGSVPKALGDLPTVGRLSGGGAILHDQELTYSFAVPGTHPLATNPTQLYELMHLAIQETLQELGVESGLRGVENKEVNGRFLCFLRGDRHDLLCKGHKILGSAQRRRKGAILQHGSLILSSSPRAPEIPGVLELSGVKIDPSLLAGLLAGKLGFFSEIWQEQALSAEVLASLDD
ncbi:MAG: hypothetical protein KDA78_18200 [Planctomycetaceae bacterium]|nr:hypothetical protein [Planctomycetaceae bacterium]